VGAIKVTTALLKHWPLPTISTDGDKEQRGRVLVIAGSDEMPGAATLSAIASLHAGAGKLAVATSLAIRSLVAQSLPEARVIALNELHKAAAQMPAANDAILIGPGMESELDLHDFISSVEAEQPAAKWVLDAAALNAIHRLRIDNKEMSVRRVLTPHAGEMANLLNIEKQQVQERAAELASESARRWHACVVLKGAITYIAMPNGQLWVHQGGDAGLATSGSGDVLAGIIAGLLARGAACDQASAWGVTLHALAGKAAASQCGGNVGYLARDISRHVPAIIRQLDATLVQ